MHFGFPSGKENMGNKLMKKVEPCTLLMGTENGRAAVEKNPVVLQEVKYGITT